MGFLNKVAGSLYGGGASVPTYDMNEAWKQLQKQTKLNRYDVSNPFASMNWNEDTNTQQVQLSPQLQSVMDNLFSSNAGNKAADSVYSSFSNRYEPQFSKQNSDLADRLINQGIPIGSAAYTQATKDLAQQQNDARLQASNQAVLTGNQTNAQNTQNALSIYSAFNPMSGYSAGAGVPQTDIYGNYYSGQVNKYQTNAQNRNALMGDLVGAASSAAMMFSDARIKENIRPVGKLFNGLTVYSFNFPGEDITRIGLLAQEVEQVIPEAVGETPEGLKMVDYLTASQYKGEKKNATSK